jgi:hypothetical protein
MALRSRGLERGPMFRTHLLELVNIEHRALIPSATALRCLKTKPHYVDLSRSFRLQILGTPCLET